MVGAGLQRDPGGGAADVVPGGVHCAQCHHLGVGLASPLGRPFAEYRAVGSADDAADARVGLGNAEAAFGEHQRLPKPRSIEFIRRHRLQ
jgi:mono/diheme cytochrome c family protein